MRWTDEYVNFIQQNLDKTDNELTKLFNRKFNLNKKPVDVKRCRLRYIGKKRKRYHFYTEEEIDFLLNNNHLPKRQLTKLFNEKFHLKKTHTQLVQIIVQYKRRRNDGK